MSTSILLGFGFSLMGCGDSTPKESPETKTTSKQVSEKSPRERPAKKNPVQEQVAAEKKGFDPLKDKSLQEICSANGLLLIKWPYDKIQEEFKTLCCTKGGLAADNYQCEMDWPFSDVPSCSAYDELRNEIFARYGRAFKTPKWQKYVG